MLSLESTKPLDSRQMAAIISSLLGGFVANGADIKDIEDAIDHFVEHRNMYRDIFGSIKVSHNKP